MPREARGIVGITKYVVNCYTHRASSCQPTHRHR